ncbi:alpha/beta hydrolase [Treponema vincentii]|uniref:alpha/beta fold hydrolase n=1 Tax=Treponema vincentii TaxID=69710 RepID=UPI0020A3DB4A|nr:alpha/beta hydrolase [Treponema vincentii]UTC59188.1 alpha/beta hydrolase [Treponema vincentii]
MNMYTNDETWKKLQAFLPERNRISASCAPSETFNVFGGANIHIDVYNEWNGNGVTLVLFHGVGGNGRLLSFIAVPLARRGYKVICPDLPGYGYTEYEGVPSYKTWIDTGVHIVRQELQRCEKLFVLGLSAGGMLAYNIACSVQGVSGVIVTTLLDNRLKPVREYSAKNKLHARFALPLLRFMPKQMRRLKIPVKAVTNMNAIVNDGRVLSLLLQDKRGAGSSVYLGFLCSMMESVPAAEPEAFELPLLLCHPEKDRWTPEWISRLFFDRIRSAKELCTLKNAGHFPIEQPGIAQLEEAVVLFINKMLKEVKL